MTTDNRTNEPTEAQIEAAAKEFERVWDENIDSFDPEQHDSMSYIKTAMRAALSAAQGAAPQAESDQPWNDPSDPNSPQFDSPWEKAAALIKSIRCAQWDILERRDQEDVRDEINGLIDRLDELATTMLAAPVLPSSGVDEDKLAEVIGRASVDYSPMLDEEAQHLARAVAEWLKGQGNAARG